MKINKKLKYMKNFMNKIKYIPFLTLIVVALFATPKPASAECWLDVGPSWMNCNPGENDDDDDGYDPTALYGTGSGNNGGNDNDNDGDNDNLNVITRSAINIDEDSATMRGEITDLDESEDYIRFFQWGTSSSNLNQTSTMSGTTDNEGTFSMTISGLNDNDTYYYRACAENVDNSNDDDCGSMFYFTTDDDDSDNDNDNDNDGNVLGATDGNILTTDATNVTATSATLNGLVTENDSSETVWFEYGPTVGLGYRTSNKTIYAQQSIVSTTIYGLTPGKAYFFRLVSADGETGDFKAFITNSATVTSSGGGHTSGGASNSGSSNSNNNSNNNTNTGEVIFETIQYLKVELVAAHSDVRPGDSIPFEVVYENLSDKNLKDVIIVVDFPKEMTVTDVGPGKLISTQKIEVRIPVLPAYTKGNFGVTAKVGEKTPDETFLVTVVNANFEHPVEKNTRMEVVNSSIIRVSMLAPFRGTQAAALGTLGFFPTTFLGWLVLVTVIIILIYVSRKLYKEREEEKKRKQKEQMAHHPELKIVK